MPRSTKKDKFFYLNPAKKGWRKGKILMGINPNYEGDVDNLTVQDLVDFLKEKNIDPVKVSLPSIFMTTAIP